MPRRVTVTSSPAPAILRKVPIVRYAIVASAILCFVFIERYSPRYQAIAALPRSPGRRTRTRPADDLDGDSGHGRRRHAFAEITIDLAQRGLALPYAPVVEQSLRHMPPA